MSIDLGKIGWTNGGEYNPATQYEKFTVVTYNGSSYVSKTSVTGIVPTNTTYWQLIAQKGETGPQGPAGKDGTSFSILGIYDTIEALEEDITEPEPGDSYFVGEEQPYDVYTWTGEEWLNLGPLQGPEGPQGAPGVRGSRWYAGTAITGKSTAPTAYATGITDAIDGDMYINTATSYVYKCTQGGDESTALWVYSHSQKGSDGSGAGDMTKAVYDADNDGIVDNAAKLGGLPPEDYAKKSDIPEIPEIPEIPSKLSDLTDDENHRLVTDAEKSSWNEAAEDINEHINESVNASAGVHGIRWFNDKLEFNNGSEWIEIVTGGGGGVPPSNVINPSIIIGDSQLTIKWTDPEDTVVDGQLISTWAGTKLVRKAGSYPTNEKDGVVLVDNKVRGTYSSTGFVDSGLTNGVTYYYQLFPYSDQGAVNRNEANRLSGTPQSYKIYGVAIDLTNSNPETAVTYTDGAVGMTAGSSAWDSMAIFKDIKPCVLKNGVVQYYLDPNDFTKKADGSAADITSGNDGDVMIEIPKTGYSISTVGNILTVKVTDDPNNPNFKYYAHTRETEGDRDKLYIGAYLGWNSGGKLRSLSGKTPTADQTIGTFRNQAQANGAGYDIVSFYPLTLLQCLFLIKYKNRDSQTALGRGYVDDNSAATNTGGTNQKGMFFGETTGKQQMKFLGIEDFWGNLQWWIDGLFCDASRNIKTAFQNFNDTGSGYVDRGKGATSDIVGHMSKPQGTTETGFIAKEASGSRTTHFTDGATLCASRMPLFGGAWNSVSDAGVFHLIVYRAADYSDTGYGARLMYL